MTISNNWQNTANIVANGTLFGLIYAAVGFEITVIVILTNIICQSLPIDFRKYA